MHNSKDPKMIEILEHPDQSHDADAVAVLIAIVGLLLALIGVGGLLDPTQRFNLVWWALAILGTSTFFTGLILRFSRTD